MKNNFQKSSSTRIRNNVSENKAYKDLKLKMIFISKIDSVLLLCFVKDHVVGRHDLPIVVVYRVHLKLPHFGQISIAQEDFGIFALVKPEVEIELTFC